MEHTWYVYADADSRTSIGPPPFKNRGRHILSYGSDSLGRRSSWSMVIGNERKRRPVAWNTAFATRPVASM
jgi:hypothetical protein